MSEDSTDEQLSRAPIKDGRLACRCNDRLDLAERILVVSAGVAAQPIALVGQTLTFALDPALSASHPEAP
jgi:hypothetical protein